MCYIWEGKIERCQQCSETDFQTLRRVIWNTEPARPSHQLIARTAQRPLNKGYQQPSRQTVHIDMHKDSTVENARNHEQDLKHQIHSSSSMPDPPFIQTAHNKRQRTSEDQASFSRHDALTSETAQHKQQKPRVDQHSSSIPNARVDGATQQEKHVVQAFSLKQGTRTAGMAQRRWKAKDQDPSSSSKHNARSEWAWGRGRKGSQQDLPSSSRHHIITNPTGEEEHRETSQSHLRIEDMEVLTAGMNKLPPPCWGDEKVFLPLAQEQIRQEEFLERQEQELDDIWGPYIKERQALAAFHAPELERNWRPVFEKEVVVERRIPLVEEIWARSMLAGENSMRRILDEDETWPPKPPEESDIWTREEGGTLNYANFKQLLRVLTLEESLKEEDPQGSDETNGAPTTWRMEERDDVTQSFGEMFTSAAYPPLAFQAQH